MEIVKAVINIGEVTIQLEGPQTFVEKYLDQYHSIIEKGLTSTSISHVTSKETKVEKAEKPAPKRTRIVRPKAGPPKSEKILELINEGFFKEQRTTADVRERLLEKGVRYESGLTSATLNNLFNSGKLERTGVGRGAKYYSNV